MTRKSHPSPAERAQDRGALMTMAIVCVPAIVAAIVITLLQGG
ncbi:hypothetical protein [Devosia yakushimensis]|nr:hypothetical protein [Devosia yakushimensis]